MAPPQLFSDERQVLGVHGKVSRVIVVIWMGWITGRVRWSLLRVLPAIIALFALSIPGAPSASADALPDGRAYEIVSPTQKSGGIGGVFPLASLTHSLEQFGRPLQSSLGDGAITYLGEDFYQPRLGSLNQYLSRFDSPGWSTQNLTPGVPSTREFGIEANLDVGFSPDLSIGVISGQTPLAAGDLAGYPNLYVAHGAQLEPIVTERPRNRPPDSFGYANDLGQPIERSLRFAGGNRGAGGASSFSHILFEANDALTRDASDGRVRANNLYEWFEGHLRLVNILPNGKADPNASYGIRYPDEYNTAQVPSLSHVISADGTKIFWTDENNGNLYMREGGIRTVQVDAGIG